MRAGVGETLLRWRCVGAGPELARHPGTLALYRALHGEEACVYALPAAQAELAGALPAGAQLSRLRCTLQIAGVSAGADAPWHYVVETDVQPGQEADFNAWYDQEHLQGLAAVPGTVAAWRFLNEGVNEGVNESAQGPRYLACYDLAALDTFGSPLWLAVRGTAWSSRVRPAFRNTRRTMYRRVDATSAGSLSPPSGTPAAS